MKGAAYGHLHLLHLSRRLQLATVAAFALAGSRNRQLSIFASRCAN